jgi:hypothetical protein
MIAFSLITAQTPKRISKAFSLDADGALVKAPGGPLVHGTVQTQHLDTMTAFAALLETLTPAQALCFGVTGRESAVIVPKKDLDAHPGAICRTREHFTWPNGSGLMLLDYDPAEGAQAEPLDTLIERISGAVPEIADAPMVALPSASSCIWHGDTELRPTRGYHLFVQVAQASDIPAIGEILTKRLWIAGHGYIALSKSGQMLQRTLVDASVWQPERLSFDGGSECGPGLEQRRGNPVILNAGQPPMQTLAALNTFDEGEYKRSVNAAKKEAMPESGVIMAAWTDERLDEWDHANPTATDEQRQDMDGTFRQAVRKKTLMGDFPLLTSTGKVVTVAEIMDDAQRWDGTRFHDPLERAYTNDSRIAVAKLRVSGRPYIYSHAHGGQRYTLLRQPKEMQLSSGEWPRIQGLLMDALDREQNVFNLGGALVSIDANGTTFPISAPWLCNEVETAHRLTKLDKRTGSWDPTQCPQELAHRILSVRQHWPFPAIAAVIRHRVMREDGSILDRPGFDAETGLYLHADPDEWKSVPAKPNREDVRKAVATLWYAVSLMPYDTPADAGAALALLLTAGQRSTLRLAPMFISSAPTYSNGKTLVCEVASLLSGDDASVTVFGKDESEQQKAIVATLITGKPSVLLDNMEGQVTGSHLAAMLTSTTFKGRLLGASTMLELPTRQLWMASGVNLSPARDILRRCLTIRLDAHVERPEQREFSFHPAEWTRSHLREMQAAALTIVRAGFQQGAATIKASALGSYSEWDNQIRRTVLWLIQEGLAPCAMADPMDTMTRERDDDPETRQFAMFLQGWNSMMGESPALVSDVVSRAQMNTADPDCAAFLSIIDELAGTGGGKINNRRLAVYMRNHTDRIADGLVLEKGPHWSAGFSWRVRESHQSHKSHSSPYAGGKCQSDNANIHDDTLYSSAAGNATNATNATECPRCGGEGCGYCRIAHAVGER